MPLVAHEYGAPGTLADVIAQVIDAFDAMGDATPILVGKKYLEGFGVGSAPRVLFVPETDGSVRNAMQMGRPACIWHGCQVFVRAAEDVGAGKHRDVERFRLAYRLQQRVIACLAVAGSGRIEWTNHGDGSPADHAGGDAELTFGFVFRADLLHDPKRWALPAAGTDATAPQPTIPPGEAGTLNTVAVTVEPKES